MRHSLSCLIVHHNTPLDITISMLNCYISLPIIRTNIIIPQAASLHNLQLSHDCFNMRMTQIEIITLVG